MINMASYFRKFGVKHTCFIIQNNFSQKVQKRIQPDLSKSEVSMVGTRNFDFSKEICGFLISKPSKDSKRQFPNTSDQKNAEIIFVAKSMCQIHLPSLLLPRHLLGWYSRSCSLLPPLRWGKKRFE